MIVSVFSDGFATWMIELIRKMRAENKTSLKIISGEGLKFEVIISDDHFISIVQEGKAEATIRFYYGVLDSSHAVHMFEEKRGMRPIV